MPDKFDPYRERLVMEVQTVWPDDCAGLDGPTRRRLELELHENPSAAARLEYLRTHTGFCRRIVVTPDDLARLGVSYG